MQVTRTVAMTRPRNTNERRGDMSDMVDGALAGMLVVALQRGPERNGFAVWELRCFVDGEW